MGKFTIFSHGTTRDTNGLRRTDVDGNEGEALRAARVIEVLGYTVDDCIECENGRPVRQVKRQGRKQ